MRSAQIAEKIKSRDEVVRVIASYRKAGRSIGFTSGVFDILHSGHVQYLQDAAEQCDVLVVGMNSDDSVRKLKGPKRPVLDQESRIRVLAGLGSVDCAFVFDERNNNVNVELLRPDVYIKAGDYAPGTLTSGSIVESYGGRVAIVPFLTGKSTTGIIEHVLELYHDEVPLAGPSVERQAAPAVFIDRDGTLIEEVDYLSNPADVRIVPGAMEAIKRLNQAGYKVILVTNQPGIGLGYYSSADFFKVNSAVLKAAGRSGALIDRIYYCPHTKADNCRCRKPKTFMIERAANELNLMLDRSFMIGDMTSDILFGKEAGVRTVLVETGKAGGDGLFEVEPDLRAETVVSAVDLILRSS